jgi:CRISPR-associated protein Csm1
MNNYFFKCDISGIQSFIFNVPSNGAAREIKTRSNFVTETSNKCFACFQQEFENVKELYKGGGNFYVRLQSKLNDVEIQDFIAKVQESYRFLDIFPYIAFIKDNGDNINDLLSKVNHEMQKAKLQRPLINDLLDTKLPPLDTAASYKLNDINGQVPKDDRGNFLDFDNIAQRSEGDQKIAALKLDVDNLGALFRDLNEEDYKILSDALKHFFNKKLQELIDDKKITQNVYVVFSGGDDCFLIGSWNVIFDLAIDIRNSFRDFQKELKQQIKLPENEITFSAGIVVIPPKYPMIRLTEEVEEALDSSKRAEDKNSITVFGKTLRWNDFECSQEISKQLKILIRDKGESRSLIERIKLSNIGFDKLQKKAQDGYINIPKVWRLKYYLRNVKKANVADIEKLFENYSQAIIKTFLGKKEETNPDLYPVAVRWAELLLKKPEKNE